MDYKRLKCLTEVRQIVPTSQQSSVSLTNYSPHHDSDYVRSQPTHPRPAYSSLLFHTVCCRLYRCLVLGGMAILLRSALRLSSSTIPSSAGCIPGASELAIIALAAVVKCSISAIFRIVSGDVRILLINGSMWFCLISFIPFHHRL